MNIIKILILMWAFLSSGCAQIGNILIPAHPDSLIKPKLHNSNALTFYPEPKDKECPPEILGMDGRGLAIKVLDAVLTADKKQYETSFSAVSSTCNFNDVLQIHFKPTASDDSTILNYVIDLSKPGKVIVLNENKESKIESLSNKVAAYPLATIFGKDKVNLLNGTWDQKIGNILGFVNPFMMIHAIWGHFDESLYETDIVAKIKIAPIINVNGENKFADIASQEIIHKIGRFNVLTGKIKDDQEPFNYYPNPVNSNNSGGVPANVRITIIEKNEVGDYIGKASELLK